MSSPYGIQITENCLICKLRHSGFFCDLPKPSLQDLERIKYASAYPQGAVLFVEGQAPRGVYIICTGRVKLSTTSRDGKTLILRIAQAGEVLGLHATVSGKPYELTAETLQPAQLDFVRREDFLRFLQNHGKRSESSPWLRPSSQKAPAFNRRHSPRTTTSLSILEGNAASVFILLRSI